MPSSARQEQHYYLPKYLFIIFLKGSAISKCSAVYVLTLKHILAPVWDTYGHVYMQMDVKSYLYSTFHRREVTKWCPYILIIKP